MLVGSSAVIDSIESEISALGVSSTIVEAAVGFDEGIGFCTTGFLVGADWIFGGATIEITTGAPSIEAAVGFGVIIDCVTGFWVTGETTGASVMGEIVGEAVGCGAAAMGATVGESVGFDVATAIGENVGNTGPEDRVEVVVVGGAAAEGLQHPK